nr:hypothetical protein [Sphingobium boeckii]
MALAFALRAGVALIPAMIHPDEIFQYLEQAHRLIFGNGVVSWEYRYNMRGWLFPVMLSGPMWLGHTIAPDTSLYIVLPKLLVAIFSLGVVAAAYALGRRWSPLHAIITMFVAAVWFECVYFGAHTLSETIAVAAVMAATALMAADNASGRRLMLAGWLLGLGVIFRFHYAPAIGIFVILSCALQWRSRWLPLIMGGFIALTIGGLIDLAMGLTPYGWILENFHQNITVDRAAGFGVSGPIAYFTFYTRSWGIWLLPILLCLMPVIKRHRALFWMAMVNLLIHSMIGHKEYRFILLTTTILVILAAIGSVEIMQMIRHRLSVPAARFTPVALLLLWTGASATAASSDYMRPRWTAYGASFHSFQALRAMPGICGIAIYDLEFWQTGGYSYLHKALPLYSVSSEAGEMAPKAATKAYNAILAPSRSQSRLPEAFAKRDCFTLPDQNIGDDYGPAHLCIFIRPGGCDPAAAPEQRLDQVMRRLDI